jgi:hypothetical protein
MEQTRKFGSAHDLELFRSVTARVSKTKFSPRDKGKAINSEKKIK